MSNELEQWLEFYTRVNAIAKQFMQGWNCRGGGVNPSPQFTSIQTLIFE